MKNYFRFSLDDADRECIIEAHKGKGKENERDYPHHYVQFLQAWNHHSKGVEYLVQSLDAQRVFRQSTSY